MLDTTFLLVGAKVATLTFGGLLTAFAGKAYLRTGSRAMGALAAGIGLVVVGAVLGGALHQFIGVSFRTGATVQALFSAAGFGLLTYALYTEDPAPI